MHPPPPPLPLPLKLWRGGGGEGVFIIYIFTVRNIHAIITAYYFIEEFEGYAVIELLKLLDT